MPTLVGIFLMSLDRWTDAFHIFMAIKIEGNLCEALLLLQFALLIRTMAKNTPGPLWLHYDREFRLQHLSDHLLPWDLVHPQLYFQLLSKHANWLCPDFTWRRFGPR